MSQTIVSPAAPATLPDPCPWRMETKIQKMDGSRAFFLYRDPDGQYPDLFRSALTVTEPFTAANGEKASLDCTVPFKIPGTNIADAIANFQAVSDEAEKNGRTHLRKIIMQIKLGIPPSPAERNQMAAFATRQGGPKIPAGT